MSGAGDRLDIRLSGTVDEAMETLRRRTGQAGVSGLLLGDQGDRLVAEFSKSGFRLRRASRLRSFYALHAKGVFSEDGDGSHLSVTFGLHPVASAAVWLQRLLGALLIVGAVLAGFRQPIFFLFAAFGTVMVGVLLWAARPRADDRSMLRQFLEEVFRAL